MADFCVKYGENPFNKKRILIIDNCDLVAQIGYTTYAPKENAKIFADYLNGANKKGSHIIEFCEGSNKIKNGVPKDQFNYIIGYAINADERNNLMGASSYSSKSVKNDRAFLAVNLELKAWFRPYSV
jgi:hypothetical protein